MTALEFATQHHNGQTRKGSDVPYITHPIAVADLACSIAISYGYDDCQSQTLIRTVALLHDVLEDTDATVAQLTEHFGWLVALYVQQLTKRDGDNYLDAILRAKCSIITRIVKIADNLHNMSDLPPSTLRDKYQLSLHILQHDIN